MNATQSLFVSNLDRGITVERNLALTSIDAAFGNHTTGPLARKCVQVAQRAVHLVAPEGGVLLYAPLTEDYLKYFREVYGYRPNVFSPQQSYQDFSKPLSLIDMVLADRNLVERIAKEGKEHDWRLNPFIAHAQVFELARRTGLGVVGMSEEYVKSGLVGRLNDKAHFQAICRKLEIPVPPSVVVRGWKELYDNVMKIFNEKHAVMLRRARGAGGLGNLKITADLIQAAGSSDVQGYLRRMMKPESLWLEEEVLVEPFLKITGSPTTLLHVEGERVRLVWVTDQVLDHEAFIGSTYPNNQDDYLMHRMVDMAMRYALEFKKLGGQGWLDIDWGVVEGNRIVAFESNARWTGNNHGMTIARRLGPQEDKLHYWTNDALKVKAGLPLSKVLTALSGHLWNPKSRTGIVISIPPVGDEKGFSMGYVALARDQMKMEELRNVMNAFAQSTFV